MQDPKQMYLFNEMEYDDYDADDYEQAYFDYLVEHSDDIDNDTLFD